MYNPIYNQLKLINDHNCNLFCFIKDTMVVSCILPASPRAPFFEKHCAGRRYLVFFAHGKTTSAHSDGHVLVITGYKWDYTFHKLGFLSA